MAKKSFSQDIEVLLSNSLRTPQPEERKEPKQEKRSVGRPRKKSTTCQNGLPEGETRMTFLVSEIQQDKLKYISFRERLSIKSIMSEAIQDYINKYEEMFGEIDLNA